MVNAGAAVRAVAESMPSVLARFDAAVDPFISRNGGGSALAAPLIDTALGSVLDTVRGLQASYGDALPIDTVARLNFTDAILQQWQQIARGAVGVETQRSTSRAAAARAGVAQAMAAATAIDEAGGSAVVRQAGGLQAIEGAANRIGDLLARDTIISWDSSVDHLHAGARELQGSVDSQAQRSAALVHADHATYRDLAGQQTLLTVADADAISGDATATTGGGWYLTRQVDRSSIFGRDESKGIAESAQRLRRNRDSVAELIQSGTTNASAEWLRGDAAGVAERMASTLATVDTGTPAGVHALQKSIGEGLGTIRSTWFKAPNQLLDTARRQELAPIIEQVAATAKALVGEPAFQRAPEAQLAAVRELASGADETLQLLADPEKSAASVEPPFAMFNDTLLWAAASMHAAPPDAPVSQLTHPHEWALRAAEGSVADLLAQPVDHVALPNELYATSGALHHVDAARRALETSRLGADWAADRHQTLLEELAARLRAIAGAASDGDSLVRVVALGAADKVMHAKSLTNAVAQAATEVAVLADDFDSLRHVGHELDAFAARPPLDVSGGAAQLAATLESWANEAAEAAGIVGRLEGSVGSLSDVVGRFSSTLLRGRLEPVADAAKASVASGGLVTRQLAELNLDELVKLTSGPPRASVVADFARRAAASLRAAASSATTPLGLAAASERLSGTITQLHDANAAGADYRAIISTLQKWTGALDELDRTYAPLLDSLPQQLAAPMRAHLDSFATEVAVARALVGDSAESRSLRMNRFPRLAAAARVETDARLLDALVSEGMIGSVSDSI